MIRSGGRSIYPSSPVEIIRYKNRKLYSKDTSTYVTLSDIRDLIKSGKTVQVLDNESSEDITAQTLAQVVSATVKAVPVFVLQELIRIN